MCSGVVCSGAVVHVQSNIRRPLPPPSSTSTSCLSHYNVCIYADKQFGTCSVWPPFLSFNTTGVVSMLFIGDDVIYLLITRYSSSDSASDSLPTSYCLL